MTRHENHCPTCGNPYAWGWEEAFDKFGFGDGDNIVMTPIVADVLEAAGCSVSYERWGMHNEIITEIFRAGQSLIPDSVAIGYADPREYLPADIVALLDRKLPSNGGAL